MKKVRLLLCSLPLLLTGCSTLSSIHWSAAAPWNWFGASIEASDQGVGGLNGETPMSEQAIGDGLDNNYRLRSGMKTQGGEVVRYFEAMKDDQLALAIYGANGKVKRIEVLDNAIATDSGVKIGTPFSELYSKAYGACVKGSGDDSNGVLCKAPDSPHLQYLFTGDWRGPEGLMPADDTLKKWQLSKIIWQG